MVAKLTGTGVNFPAQSSAPANPVVGQVYYDTNDKFMRQWNGTNWDAVAKGDGIFKYKQIITTSYVMGGYKDNTPWRNVNRMVHSTDVMTNLGDVLVYSASYSPAAPSLTKGWMFAAANAHSSATTNVVAINFASETGIAANSANYLNTAVNDAGVAFKEHEYVHITGGGTTSKFNFTSESSTASGLSILADGTGPGVQAVCDQYWASLYNDGSGQSLQFTTDIITTDRIESGVAMGIHNQQKPINSKVGKGYAGNEGTYNGGYNYRVWDMTTRTQARTVGRPHANNGEENFDMGQDHQYMMGEYNGAQNNNGHKFFYASDSGYTLGSGSVRTGVPGGSSGGCVWKG